MNKGALLIGIGFIPTESDVQLAVQSGGLKNCDVVHVNKIDHKPANNGELMNEIYALYKSQMQMKGWKATGVIVTELIINNRVVYGAHPAD